MPAVIGYLWYSYKNFSDEYNETPSNQRLESQKDNVEFYYYSAIVASVLGGFIILILLVLRSRLALLTALFKEAGRALRRMPLLLFFPVLVRIGSRKRMPLIYRLKRDSFGHDLKWLATCIQKAPDQRTRPSTHMPSTPIQL